MVKLFGDQFEATGQWATTLTSKSEVDLMPLLAQVGECRQMFSECFEKESSPCTSSVSQDIQGTHSHMDRFSLPVSPEPEGDFAHIQQFSDYLSFGQVGDECDESRNVSAQMQICDRSGQERSNLFCHHAKRAEGVVNIVQCNVTAWSEHAKHYILTSGFDAALISGAHLEREKLVTAAKDARKYSWTGTVQMKLEFSAPTCDWQVGSYVSWEGDFVAYSLFRALRRFSAAISTPS